MNVIRTALGVLVLTLATVSRGDYKVQIGGGDRDLKGVVLAAEVPDGFPASGLLRSDSLSVPFQRTSGGEIVFALPEWKRGQRAIFSVTPSDPKTNVLASPRMGKVEVTVNGKPAFTYQGVETPLPRPEIKPVFKRGGYLHPVLSPSGKLITDDYPPNHLHHHGIWFPWTKTTFAGHDVDFWNMGEGKGRVEFVTFGESWSGPVEGGFTAEQRFVDLTGAEPKVVLNETWQVTACAIPGVNYTMFDLVSTQRCATDIPLILPKYYYGGLGFRGNWNWNGEDKCMFLTANGETNRVKGNETRANWCYIGGEVDGTVTGVTIFCHPSNFRAPQPMRLHPKEPFFCFAPSQLGDWTIEPGKPLVSRYRFVVKDGPPIKEELDAIWAAYGNPPPVKIIQ